MPRRQRMHSGKEKWKDEREGTLEREETRSSKGSVLLGTPRSTRPRCRSVRARVRVRASMCARMRTCDTRVRRRHRVNAGVHACTRAGVFVRARELVRGREQRPGASVHALGYARAWAESGFQEACARERVCVSVSLWDAGQQGVCARVWMLVGASGAEAARTRGCSSGGACTCAHSTQNKA
eukprot:534590-Pleurochrysis_carterae.AAC.2